MSDLLKTLMMIAWRFIAPHAIDGEPDAPEDDEPPEDDGDSGDDDGAQDIGDGGAEPDTPPPKPDAASARLEAAERAAREAQESVQALQRQSQRRPDPSHDEEERKLRDPNTSRLEKWQIESNRSLRQSHQQSANALFQAQDMADKTGYTVKSAANPVYSKYADKVEAELTRARANGANPPREMILQVLLGRDMLAGNFKPAAAKPGKAKDIPRGRSPGARSDTPARGNGGTEHQKRYARLANVPI